MRHEPESRMKRPILVTGMPRSGTSWVGKMLDASGSVVYVNEPLNPQHPPGGSPGVLRVDVSHRFEYICAANEHRYLPAFRDLISLRYHALDEVKKNHSGPDLLRLAKYWSSFLRGRVRGRRPLVDDPFAVFSAGWFVERLDCDAIVIVRHPAAVVNSRKQLGHTIDFRHLLDQPLLMHDWLDPFRAEMEALRRGPTDVIGQGSLLWRMVYHVVDRQRAARPGLRVVRHEDLSFDPVREYASLYHGLGLAYTEAIRREIEAASGGPSRAASHSWSVSRRGLSKTGFRRLDSRAHAKRWRAELGPAEVARIRSLTEDVAARFYSDSDWQ
jgi:hypothetical protein